ncbi:MAG TPA: serine/threonine-protein kinase [Gemmatimonadales bacterium]|nr:serine/threonine-protein kinase [Gemmatimonadales bacterium]
MTDLRDQLQAALGSTYRIEQELGGGGMSRVFLAEETALGRKVVVKVLPPEMAAGVNIERFRREIQLAASLQHPHIVPLYAAGQAGDLFYYTMPLVEGESLRAKLAREGQLPVEQVVRILRDVTDALAYAHAHGVVHRDIKPDNVLVSNEHAVVTDFGVAKAVSAASGSSTLTSLGVALGTPAYMAPEQAAADPHIDHRADLYATGVMGYEMLTGRLPFNAPTPQAMLAAHVTQPIEPPVKYRPAIPAAFNALLMRCLEKMPADRVQRADELRTQLQAMATPSGGMPPTGATPVISSGTEAAIRRGHPVRVAALFGLAGIAVLAVVYFLMQRLGLPTWVFVGAVVLLGIGLPIMLTTGVFERRRALATTGFTPAPQGVASLFTWKRALWGGGLAFAGLAGVATVYMAMRLLGIGAVGTLVAKGALKEREPILLADFENRTSDSTLGTTLTEAFRVDLSQSRTVKLLDATQVAAGLARMQRPAGSAVAGAVARELAQRAGVKAIVTGQIDPVGKSYVVTASVISAADGSVLTAVRENAADDAALLGALDRLSRGLRERIGESLTSVRDAQHLEQVTTGSLEALRRYTDGVRRFDNGEVEAALPLFQQAVAIDTGFAMAYRKIAAALGNVGGSRDQIAAAASRAYAHRDRLPDLERTLATAYYHKAVDWDPAAQVAAYREALDIDAYNDVALNNLGLELQRERQFAAAESLFQRGTDLGQGDNPYINLVWDQAAQGRFRDAHASAARFAAASPSDAAALGMPIWLAYGERDFSATERLVHDFLSRRQTPFWRGAALVVNAAALGTQGKLAEFERQVREVDAIAELRGVPANTLNSSIWLAWADLRYRNKPGAGVARIGQALQKHPLASLPAADRPYAALAWYYAAAGQLTEAERLLAEYAEAVPAGLRRGDYLQNGARGAIAVAQNRLQDAVPLFRAAYDSSGCDVCALFELASVYEQLQQPDSAIALYRRYVDIPGLDRNTDDPINLAPAYRRLGDLYAERGDRANAATYYNKLLDLWKSPDPELQPIVADVKQRLAALAGEH